ncbi:carboxyltransferase subunit alpha [Micromonospora sp. NPDC051925]|uniref:carboxyltransferase subunit alpha n=1 Tax=Micromonospora sp. NPDC051925 TaxID=3364288 RepID=UPI0037CB1358
MTTAAEEQRWSRCAGCAALLYRRRLRRNLDVCPHCGQPSRLTAPERLRQLLDPDTFTPLPGRAVEVDPIGFVDTLPYRYRLSAARAGSGLDEAALCGVGRIGGHRVALAVLDFRFLGGSLGCAVGELITRTAERALADRTPLLLVTTAGGARLQEGTLALMQLATVSQAVAGLREAALLTVSVVPDPGGGEVIAPFAANTDLVLAESGTRTGPAGPRVIRQVTDRDLAAGRQSAEALLRHGLVDMVVPRWVLRDRLVALLASTANGRGGARRVGVPRSGTGLLATVAGGRAGAARVRVPWEEPARGGPLPAGGAEPAAVAAPRAEVLGRRPVAADPWEIVRAARHPGRPTTLDYLDGVFDGFVELHGDRLGADCPAVVGGPARLDGQPVMVVGHQKGHHPAELAARNFGMASPAGHRKALRLVRLAARLGLPVVTLVDTPGADPGTGTQEHAQAAAIAENILTLSVLPTPVVAVVTGEGGSGGALALAVADRVLMLRQAVYSVISPEGCAAILWPDGGSAPQAARALRLTAPDLCRLGVADEIVDEPPGGAQADPRAAALLLRRALVANLAPLLDMPPATLVRRRRARFRRFGTARPHRPVLTATEEDPR